MRSLHRFFGALVFGFGILLSLWVSTSLLGRAHSQTQAIAPKPPAATAAAPRMVPAVAPTPPPAPNPGQQPPRPPGSNPPSAAGVSARPPGPGVPPSVPAVEAAAPETMPVFQNPEGYSYDPTGRRDPFRPYGQSQTNVAPDLRPPDEPAKPVEPLQQFDVSQLKVVGIMWEVRNPKAMVKDPAGKLHMIQRQTRIGRNNGFVAAIREGEIVVVEPAIGDNGLQTASTRVLTLTR